MQLYDLKFLDVVLGTLDGIVLELSTLSARSILNWVDETILRHCGCTADLNADEQTAQSPSSDEAQPYLYCVYLWIAIGVLVAFLAYSIVISIVRCLLQNGNSPVSNNVSINVSVNKPRQTTRKRAKSLPVCVKDKSS